MNKILIIILLMSYNCFSQNIAQNNQLNFFGITFGDTVSKYPNLIKEVNQSYIYGSRRMHFVNDKSLIFQNKTPFYWTSIYSIDYKIYSLTTLFDSTELKFNNILDSLNQKFGKYDSISVFDTYYIPDKTIKYCTWQKPTYTIELTQFNDLKGGKIEIVYNYLKDEIKKSNTYEGKGNSTFIFDFVSIHNLFTKPTNIKEFEKRLPEFRREINEKSKNKTNVTYYLKKYPISAFAVEYDLKNRIIHFSVFNLDINNTNLYLKKYGYRSDLQTK